MNLPCSLDPTPIIGARIATLLDEAAVSDWVRGFGSPLHVVIPEQARENYRRWKEVLSARFRNVEIQFALKSCKSISLLRALALAGAGADVSSAQEMTAAFMQGVPARRMTMSGPAKSTRDIMLCLTHRLSLHVDCLEELCRILSASTHEAPAERLLLRLRPIGEPNSRFGMTDAQVSECLATLKAAGHTSVGFSFHVNDYEVSSRAAELRRAINLAQALRGEGLRCFAIDVGGGYPMRYLPRYSPGIYDEASRWSAKSAAGTYPYAAEPSGEQHCAAVLDAAIGAEEMSFLLAEKIAITLQPGRALLDQCGLTLFDVIETKALGRSRIAAVLDGMSFSLSETWFGSDFVPEPVILRREIDEGSGMAGEEDFFLVGRSCLESDLIRHRRVRSSQGLRRGDLVAFINTAGYQMDSNESTFHQLPLPLKVAAVRGRSGWQVRADEHGCEEEPS